MRSLKAVGAIYIAVGVLNSLYLWATVSMSACSLASGILLIYCNTGLGLSHAVSILLWPLFWLN